MIDYTSFKLDLKHNELVNQDLENENLINSINEFGSYLLSLYLEHQDGKNGISQLGNPIRYSTEINKTLEVNRNSILVKVFENRRSFPKIFIDTLLQHNDKDIAFLILEETFGVNSRIVDNSFIRKEQIESFIKEITKIFSFNNHTLSINFIEINGFKHYFVFDNNGYSKLKLNE